MRGILLIVIALFAIPAGAATYTFNGHINLQLVSGKASAEAACSDPIMVSACNAQYGSSTRASAFHHVERVSDTSYRCYYQLQNKQGDGSWVNASVVSSCNGVPATSGRSGDICPQGQSYNATLGKCEYPACPSGQHRDPTTGICTPDNPCEPLAGTTDPFQKGGYTNDGWGAVSGTSFSFPSIGCMNSCDGVLSGVKCRLGAGDPPAYLCKGTFNYSGAECGSGTSGNVNGDTSGDLPPPEPTNDSSDSCGSWVSSADGKSKTCISTSTSSNDGSTDCTSGTCTSTSPDPSSSHDETTTTTTEKTNSDGTTTTTKTTTIESTSCTLSGCTSTTTTKTDTETKDQNGNSTGKTSSCTGTKCNGSGSGGTGTGTGGSGGGGTGISISGGYGGELVAKDQGNFDSANEYWDQKIFDSKEELREKLADIKSTVSSSVIPSLPSGSGSLPCEPTTFGDGYEFDLCFTPFEGALAGFKTFILFIAALIAFWIVFVRS